MRPTPNLSPYVTFRALDDGLFEGTVSCCYDLQGRFGDRYGSMRPRFCDEGLDGVSSDAVVPRGFANMWHVSHVITERKQVTRSG